MLYDLNPRDQARLLKAYWDPVYFATAILGVELFPKQAEILRSFYQWRRDDHGRMIPRYRELVWISGMRSGKSFMASLIALYEAFRLALEGTPQLRYGLDSSSPLHVMLVAASEEQAQDALFSHIRVWVNRPLIRALNPKVRKDTILFRDANVELFVGPSTSSTLVGRTVKCFVLDELARFDATVGKRGARMVYEGLKAASMTLYDSVRIIISSPLSRNDLLWQLYERGLNHPDVLAIRTPTWEVNPGLTREQLEREYSHDPIAFLRDFAAEPTGGYYPFFTSWDLIKWHDHNVLELLANNIPVQGESYDYVLAGDPAIRHDAFGWALAHRDENGRIIVDGAYRQVPPKRGELDPLEVRGFVEKILRRFRVHLAVFDIHMYPELQHWLRRQGVLVVTHIVRYQDYQAFKEQLYLGNITLPDYRPLKDEMRQLQVINERRVDHPRGGSKDVIDAVVNTFWALQTHRLRRIPYALLEPL